MGHASRQQGPVAKTYANLDVLRSIAVLLVFADHLWLTMKLPESSWISLPALGRLGVVLFFFHTSLVLMMSMKRIYGGSTASFLITFGVRRFFRIYPLSIVFVLATYFFHIPSNNWLGTGFQAISQWQLWSNLLLIQNVTRVESVLAPLWSLPLEVQMYCFLPFLYMLTLTPKWPARFIAVLLVAASAAYIVHRLTGKMNLLAFIPCFLAGVLAFRLGHTPGKTSWVIGIGSLLVLVFAVAGVSFLFPAVRTPAEWALCFLLAVSWRRFADVRIPWICGTAEWIARYSYGIYLSHIVALWMVFQVFGIPGRLVPAFASVLLTGAISIATFHLIESPCIEAGKRLATRLAAKPVAWVAWLGRPARDS